MHPELTEEHEALRKVVREFVDAEIEPHAEAWDRDHTFPVDTVLAMGELGLFGIPFPEPYGGGGDLTGLCVAIEEVARVDQSMAITLEAGVGLGANPIYKFGTPEQQERWLPDLCAGRALGGFGLTEPDAGSDAGGTRTRAELDESTGEWVIDGEKAFITNSGTPITSLVTVTALDRAGRDLDDRRAGRHARHGGAAAVPQDGLARVGHPRADVRRVPGAGGPPARAAWPGVRPVPGDPRRGPDRHRRARRRGDPAVRRRLGRLRQRAPDVRAADRLEPGRSRSGAPTWRWRSLLPAGSCTTPRGCATRGGRSRREAAVAKLFATEAAIDATRSATQVFGGYGFMDETPVARHYRDAKILEIGEGTSEVQRLVISRALGLRV